MLHKLLSNRGAVSVFLVIILVPMITCASLFVDASRVKSARGLVNSAGDLTLNTVLSQYDVDLNDFYGMMASAQNMDDVISAASDYFTACITSQGIDTTNAAKYVNSITGFFLGDDDISDLLGISLAEDTSVTVSPVSNGSLTNPALVKTQIVEFMKYRSPINSIVSLFNRFKSSASELEDTSKSADLVEKKQDYYEAQGEVAGVAYQIYKKIVEYTALGITENDLQQIKNLLNGIEEKYKDLHVKMVKDLYNTQGLSDANIKQCLTTPTRYTHQSKYDSASASDIKKQIDSLMRAYDQFINAKKSFENNVKQWPTSGNSYYDIQYWAHCCKNNSYFSNVYNKANNLRNAYINLWDMIEHAEEGATAEAYTSTYGSSNLGVIRNGTTMTVQEWFDFLKPRATSAIDSVANQGTRYYNTVSRVKNCSDVWNRISTTATNNELANLYNQLNDYAARYKKGFDLLAQIVDGLNELKGKVTTADNLFDTWENKANEYEPSGIQMATDDLEEIATVKREYSKLYLSDIESYSSHINNVKSALGTVTNGIKNIKYNGASIVDRSINSYNTFKRYSDVLGSEIPLYNSNLEDYANATFHFSMEGVNIQSLNYTANNDPNIAQRKFRVYEWMLDEGFQLSQNTEKGESDYNSKVEAAEKQADTAYDEPLSSVASSNDITSLSNLPSGVSSNLDAASITTKISEVSSFVGSLFSNFGDTMAQAGTDLRDTFFVMDYITSMFTWQTFEFESKYNMLDKTQQRNITFNTAASVYASKNDAWASDDPTDTYNKTLTNKLRNSTDTNWSYCNEVEYIMYGKSAQESRNALNSAIYMIRFALDLVPIFTCYYKDIDLQGFAMGIAAATYGVIPAALVKIVVCLGLVALEAATDLKTLKCGIPVILVKNGKHKAELFVQSWTFIGTRDNPSVDKTQKTTFSYSDYMKLILFIKMLGSEAYNIYGRIADVVQTNMSKCVLQDDSYVLSNSQVYYSISATVKVKPLMLDTSYVESFISNASEQLEGRNTISYTATRGY